MIRSILWIAVAVGAGLGWATAAIAAAEAPAPAIIDVAARPILYVSLRAPIADPAAIGKALGEAYGKVLAVMGPLGLEEDGAPLAITRAFDPKGDWVFDAAIPVKAAPTMAPTNDEVKAGATPAGRVVKAVHIGPYADMQKTYASIMAFMKANNLKQGPLSWEEYVSDPANTPQDKLITNVYFQIAP